MANEKRLIDLSRVDLCEVDISDCTDVEDIFSEIITYLYEQPEVDSAPAVHGRWLDVKETEVYSPDHRCTFTRTAETCSNCKVRIGFIGAKLYLFDATCPNCGAKMDGGNEDGSSGL